MSAMAQNGLGRRAVERGWISESQLAEAELQAARDGCTLGQSMLRSGRLSAEQLAELLSEDRERRAAAARSIEEEPAGTTRYEIGDRIGRGGSASVYRAFDRELGREVAMKVVHDLPEPQRLRFEQEARAAARISNPNVVQVFDVGGDEERAWIVMELIEGPTLDAAPLDLAGKLAALEKAARAAHYIHERGIVHRDLKPSNIVVSASGEPKIVDFGIAHVEDAQRRLTVTGTILGTPEYMAPEQVQGKPTDARTDVYALGAILHELLSGRPPYTGHTMAEILTKIVLEDPAPLGPDTPAPLRAICARAMEREPGARYPTAAELADDLRRYLDGRPVIARPRSRLGRKLKQNTAAIAVALLLLGTAILAWRLEAARAESIETLRRAARMATEAALEFRRQGANEKMRKFYPELERAYELAPDLAEVHYLMGRMHRALMQFDEALQFQNRAIERDPLYAPAIYERVVLQARSYERQFQRRIDQLRAADPEADRSRASVERAFPELGQLRAAIALDAERASRIEGARADAARGILAYLQRDLPRAESILRRVVEAEPRLEEAWEALAQCRGSEETYTEAISNDRGYRPHWIGRARVRLRKGRQMNQQGRDPIETLAAAESDCAEAIRLGPEDHDGYRLRATVRSSLGICRRDRGEDPLPDWARSDADFRQLIERGADMARAHRAAVLTLRARYLAERREDPKPDLLEAIEECARVVRENPKKQIGYLHRGMAHSAFGAHSGEDPMASWANAEADYGEAIRLDPEDATGHYLRGNLRSYRAAHRQKRGEDAEAEWESAERDYGEAIRLDPRHAMSLLMRGAARIELKRPKEALDDLTRAAELNPKAGAEERIRRARSMLEER
jgi:serine/threonine-protein kinase